METFVVPSALQASVADTVSNVTSTAAVITGGAALMGSSLPAGSDEASALASANTSVHAANFLAVAAMGLSDMARYAGNIAMANATYEMVDDANASQFI